MMTTKTKRSTLPTYRAATDDEKRAYREQRPRPIYPLRGWVMIDGTRCAVEDLREWPREDPQFEIVAPSGMHFVEGPLDNPCEILHTLLAHTVRDVRERAAYRHIAPCTCDSDEQAALVDTTDARLAEINKP